MASSKVVFLDRIPSAWTEQTLRQVLMPIGDVRKIVLLRKRHALFAGFDPRTLRPAPCSSMQALVETADLAAAERIVRVLREAPVAAGANNEPVTANYSKIQELRARGGGGGRQYRQTVGGGDGGRSNRILLITVQNPTYPVTTDFVHDIFSAYGVVEKVVLFVKPVGLQCLVQFASLEEAIEARKTLNGLSIFPDCCGLVINYSNLTQELVVKENGPRSKDFLNPDLPEAASDEPMNPVTDPNAAGAAARKQSGDNEQVEDEQVGGRDGTSPVLLVCNLRQSVTCDNLFNLFSCYGNVARVKKLSSKPDHALVQFSTSSASQSALLHLRGFTLLGRSLEISFSKHSHISARSTPGSEHEAAGMREYGLSLNRFTGKYANATRHIYSPTKILHMSNVDDDTSEEDLKNHFAGFRGGESARVKVFTSPSGQTQGLVEFPSADAATSVLAQAHNSSLRGKRLKLAFSRHPFH